jgi:hypothetical protein
MLERPTDESASSSSPGGRTTWDRNEYPTPTADRYGTSNNGQRGAGSTYETSGNPSLATWARTQWATPRAEERQQRNSQDNHVALSLQVKQWATPQAHDAATPKTPAQIAAMKARAPKRANGGPPGVTNLNEQTATWPTATASDGQRGRIGMRGKNAEGGPGLDESGHGPPDPETEKAGRAGSPPVVLNPRFVEALMGLPVGWVDPSSSAPSETP